MTDEETSTALTISQPLRLPKAPEIPAVLLAAGRNAKFAWDEFFGGQIRNRHTRMAYLRAVRSFLEWVEERQVALLEITPGMIGAYIDQHPGSPPTKQLQLSALRAFFNVLVNRHVLIFNPALTVRGEKYHVMEGKTPEITREQARQLLASIRTTDRLGEKLAAGVRDKALIATLIYTAARAGAVANLKVKDFTWDGSQYTLRFLEKGGKSRLIPVRHDLQLLLVDYLSAFDWQREPKDAPLFRSLAGRTRKLTNRPISNIDVCRLIKRRLNAAGLPNHFSPHSIRVATVTDLLNQGTSLEDVQYLAGHSDPRTTRLYDRRQKQVTRNTVERISI